MAKASEELRDEVIHAGIVDYVTGQCLGPQAVLKAEKAADFHSGSNTFDNDERSLM